MSFESVEQSFGWWKHCYLGVGIRPQGRFLFTRRAIKAGELILAERGAHIGRPDAIVAAIAKDPRCLVLHPQQGTFKLTLPQAALVRSQNAWGDTDHDHISVLMLHGSMPNHSCDPNAHACSPPREVVPSENPLLCLYARRDIAALEEITVSYNSGDHMITKQERAVGLSHWFRTCQCSVCVADLSPSEIAALETKQMRFNTTLWSAKQWPTDEFWGEPIQQESKCKTSVDIHASTANTSRTAVQPTHEDKHLIKGEEEEKGFIPSLAVSRRSQPYFHVPAFLTRRSLHDPNVRVSHRSHPSHFYRRRSQPYIFVTGRNPTTK